MNLNIQFAWCAHHMSISVRSHTFFRMHLILCAKCTERVREKVNAHTKANKHKSIPIYTVKTKCGNIATVFQFSIRIITVVASSLADGSKTINEYENGRREKKNWNCFREDWMRKRKNHMWTHRHTHTLRPLRNQQKVYGFIMNAYMCGGKNEHLYRNLVLVCESAFFLLKSYDAIRHNPWNESENSNKLYSKRVKEEKKAFIEKRGKNNMKKISMQMLVNGEPL